MATEVTLPELGSQATVLRWLRGPGDLLAAGDPLVIVLTDTAELVLPAPAAGSLELLAQEGTRAASGAPLARIGAEPAPAQPDQPAGADARQPGQQSTAGARLITPTALCMARREGMDLAALQGSGPDGRITRRDVERALKQAASSEQGFCIAEQIGGHVEHLSAAARSTNGAPPARASAPAATATPGGDVRRSELVPLSAMRRAIAEHMRRSKQTAPHLTSAIEVDLGQVAELRSQLRAPYARRGVELTYTACLAYAVVQTLRLHPRLNATWHQQELVQHAQVNLGIAVALEAGLVVPVIRQAGDYNLQGLSRSINDLAVRARAGALRPDETQAGSFTITNPGAGVIRFGVPVIPQPQVAILGVGAIQKRVGVVGADGSERLAIRPLTVLTLSADARVVDLAVADAFLAALKQCLEHFSV